jgi:hypothetical protein
MSSPLMSSSPFKVPKAVARSAASATVETDDDAPVLLADFDYLDSWVDHLATGDEDDEDDEDESNYDDQMLLSTPQKVGGVVDEEEVDVVSSIVPSQMCFNSRFVLP